MNPADSRPRLINNKLKMLLLVERDGANEKLKTEMNLCGGNGAEGKINLRRINNHNSHRAFFPNGMPSVYIVYTVQCTRYCIALAVIIIIIILQSGWTGAERPGFIIYASSFQAYIGRERERPIYPLHAVKRKQFSVRRWHAHQAKAKINIVFLLRIEATQRARRRFIFVFNFLFPFCFVFICQRSAHVLFLLGGLLLAANY